MMTESTSHTVFYKNIVPMS